MALRKYFVLKSNYNEKYLEYVEEPVEVCGLNKFSGENPGSPYGIYEMEKAKTGERLVHIKCCYNNRYLVRRLPLDCWIASTAAKPEEDMSKWSCTLFEILHVDANKIRLRHVQLEHYASLRRLGSHNPYDSCLFAGSKEVDPHKCDVFTIEVGSILNDGTYTSVNSCNFKYETKEEKQAAAGNLIEQLASVPI